MKSLEDVSLLIIGYDPYRDVWDHYFELLNKYWSDRPKTYLATNILTPDYIGVTVLPTSQDAEWSKKVYDSLDYIDTKYVILLLEDFFTTRKVDNSRISDLMEIIKENQIQYCKLLNQAKFRGEKFKEYGHLRISEKSDMYAISLQPAVWEKSFLKECVGPENYNAWIFELYKARTLNVNNDKINVLSDDRNILEITHAIVQSNYLRKAVRVFNKQNYKLNFSQRGVMSVSDTLKYRSKIFFAQYIPKALWKPFKAVGRILNINFVSDKYKR
ncbi:hypothetical protein [Streptococcus porcinus]|uniref:Uncharacterized protein n=1 Tax=Streptococcus porcinus TaxID=1340 RepID=A0A7V9WT70_STRPO|nr:hypothetical protein [Streptococcus porcinus]MBA2796622.1 hypothetical protein [Streptococcus porcinus]